MQRKIVGIFISTLLIASLIIPVISGITINRQFSPVVIDQEQTDASEEHWLEWGVPNWQTFVHKGEVLEEVDLFFGCWFTGSADVTLSIEESVSGPELCKVTYQAADFPNDVCDWFTFDVPDTMLNKNQIYFIIIKFDIGSEYCWHGAHGDPYVPGSSSHPDADWDYAFRTHVDKKSKVKTQPIPGIIGQQQTDTSETHFLQNGMIHYQQFENFGHTIEEVHVHIGHYFGGSEDMTLSIERPLGTKITFKTLTAADIPDHYQDWCVFDVPDETMIVGALYYLVIEFGDGSEYVWSGAHGDPYPAGASSHPDADWDYAFITFVDKKPRNINLMGPGVIDQQQTDTSESYFLENYKTHYQQFKNKGHTIEEVHVHIAHYYSGSEPMNLSIRKPLSNIITTKTLTTADIPDHALDWCVFDVPDAQLTPGEIYYIVIEFDCCSEYEWSGAHGDPYPDGVSSHPDSDWDFAFKTIVDRKSRSINYILDNYPMLFQMFQKFFNNLQILTRIL